ncbi:TolC family protein [Schlesneria paludicola]|uniref:TolC family protein n=1 Tax=Schlesneria paludicola TaxID=360056 RepID=UPI000299D08D|nr:TolC family protein [Schlesneria paludicola]
MKRQATQWMGFVSIASLVLAGCRSAEKSISLSQRPDQRQSTSTDKDRESRSLATRKAQAASTETSQAPSSPEEVDDTGSITSVAWQVPEQPSSGVIDGDQSPSPSGDVLTLNELQEFAVTANPTLQQAYALLQQAQGNWAQVGLYPNPTLVWHDEANNAPFDAHFGVLSQDIVTGKKLQLNRAVASSDVQRAQLEAEAQNLRVLNEVQIRYIEVLGAERQVLVAEELLKIADDGVSVSERFFKAEQVSQADVLQATIQQRQTQILLRNARFRAAAARKSLGNVIGWPDMPPRPLGGALEDELQDVDWDVAWQELLNRSPQLHAAQARLASAQVQIHREQVEPIPNLQVSGGAGRDILPADQSFQMFTVSVGTNIPVWNRNQGNIMAAEGYYRAAQAEVTRLELSLRDDLADAYQRYQSARSEMEIYRDQIVPTAESNLALTQKAYEEGEFDFLRVLTARRDLFQARVNYVTALTDLRSAVIEIRGLLLTGGLDPTVSNPSPSNSAGQTSDAGH